MGQTLTHGVYLPDEGERNCYSGLAANWSILDGAVGTVAEHTAALSGKAPLVHTHVKADITDFPAYGTTAGTICEGNDSRLSDARTPVAHTHVTSEVLKTGSVFTGGTVTNPYFKIASWEMGANQYFGAVLLVQNPNYPRNQAFVNIEIRTYSNYNFQTGYLYLSNDCGISKDSLCICYKQESNKVLCELYYYNTAAWNGIFFSVLNESLRYGGGTIYLFQTMTVYNQQQADAVANLPAGYTVIQANYMPLFQNVTPGANNTYDLGSSSYQWNNLYAKNYYYNGTAWGLDKANTWSASQTLAANAVLTVRGYRFRIKNDSMILGTVPSNNLWTGFSFTDKNDNLISEIIQSFQKNGNSLYQINVFPNEANAEKRSIIAWTYNSANSVNHASFSSNVIPQNTNTYELGISNNKWKTLNGINPGALSLPKIVAKTTADISSAIVGSDGETQHLDGTDNNYTAALDGWISICISGFVNNELWITVYDQQNETWGTSAESSTRNNMFIIFPVRANQKMRIRMKCTSVTYARFYPCEGNV